jgi:hypothetical protein
MPVYDSMCGDHINTVVKTMIALARKNNDTYTTTFNEIPVSVAPGDTLDAVIGRFHAESDRRHQEYIASPEYKKRQEEEQARQMKQEADLKAALATSPEHMTLKDAEGWQKSLAANQDPYGSACLRYAEKWARLMEGKIAEGQRLEDCAEAMSHLADDEGITGFMYGCAVGILSGVWQHGEQLRRWHNLKTQIRNEGEKANAEGGVLNPAMLGIR